MTATYGIDETHRSKTRNDVSLHLQYSPIPTKRQVVQQPSDLVPAFFLRITPKLGRHASPSPNLARSSPKKVSENPLTPAKAPGGC